MPYSPGAQDISGQLIAQGMNRGQDAYYSNLNNNINQFFKTREEDSAFQAKNKAMQAMITANKEEFGLNDETLKPFLKGSTFESPRDAYARMGTFVETNVLMANQKRAAAEAKSQNDLRAATAARYNQEVADAAVKAKENEAQKTLLRLAGEFDQKAPLPAKMQVAPELGQFLYGNSATPSEVPSYLNDTFNSNVASANRGSGVLSPAVQQDLKTKLDDPVFREILQVFNATGKVPDANVVERIMSNRDLATIRDEQKRAAAKVVNQSQPRDEWNPQTKTRETVIVDTVTGKEISRVTSKDDAQFSAKNAAMIQEQVDLAKREGLAIEGVKTEGESAEDGLEQNKQIRALIKSGAKSGALRAAIPNIVTDSAVKLGILEAKKQASDEQLQALLGQSALENAKKYYKGQGSVSNQERQAVADISLSFEKGTLTNLQMMDELDKVHRRSIAKRNYIEEFRNENPTATSAEVVKEIQNWNRRKENALENFEALVNPSDMSVKQLLQEKAELEAEKAKLKAEKDKPSDTP